MSCLGMSLLEAHSFCFWMALDLLLGKLRTHYESCRLVSEAKLVGHSRDDAGGGASSTLPAWAIAGAFSLRQAEAMLDLGVAQKDLAQWPTSLSMILSASDPEPASSIRFTFPQVEVFGSPRLDASTI